jgi:hypothetical protein
VRCTIRVHRLQDGRGDLLANSAGQPLFTYQMTAPVNGISGFATGCVWINYLGTPGGVFYVNNGTNLSTNWVNLA